MLCGVPVDVCTVLHLSETIDLCGGKLWGTCGLFSFFGGTWLILKVAGRPGALL